ncbi:hypothetical protein GBA52_018394 [Prunus armeniaca]|nr:hypothetical protein GBA52_018394 [Prunus armeniaca]
MLQSGVAANDSMKSNEEPQAAKKTRELPKLSECHSCHLRVDIANANAKSKLHVLYSEWRIVLLCKKCFSRVESSELCSCCFSTSLSQESFSCRQCNRRVHRHCDSEYQSVALLSDSSSAMEFSVCTDCRIPESLVKWRGVVSNRKARRTGKRRVGLGLGKSRVSAMVDDGEIDDAFAGEEGSNSRRDEDAAVDDDGPSKEGEVNCSNGVELGSPTFCKQEECICISTPKEQRCNAKVDPFYFKHRKRSTLDRYVLTYKKRRPKNLNPRALDIEEESEDDDGPLKEGEVSCSNGVDLKSPTFCKQEQEECICITTPKERRCNAKLDPFFFKYRKRSTLDRYVLTYKRRKPKSLYACYTFTYKRRRPRILYARSTGSS